MLKKAWLIGAILIFSFLLFSTRQQKLLTSSSLSSVEATTEQSIVIGYSNWAGWWPWAIADAEGIFERYGMDVELRWYDDYTQSLEDLASGYIDGNSQTLSDTISFAANAVKGEVAVLVNDNSAGNDKIIVEEQIRSVKELKNKQVLIEAGVVDDFLLTLALSREGMTRDELKIIDIETGAAVEAFAIGEGDAVGAFSPFWLTALKREKAKELISSAEFPGAIPDLLVVTQELIDKNPNQVQCLINVWFDVLEFMTKNQVRSDEIMASRADINYKQMQLFKSGTKMFTIEDNIKAFTDAKNMSSLYYASIKVSDFLQNKFKNIPKKPEISKLLNSNFVRNYQQDYLNRGKVKTNLLP